MRSLRKIPTRFCGTYFCTTSARFAPSFLSQPNGHECTKIVQNTPTRQFRVQWGGLGAFVVKSSTRLRGTNFCTSSARFAPSFVRQPNGRERTQIEKKRMKTSVYGAMGWIGCVRCEKFRRDFVARSFELFRPVLHLVSQGNQMVPNAHK